MQRVVPAESIRNLLPEDLYDPVTEGIKEYNINAFIRNIVFDINVHIAILKNAGDRNSIKTHV